LKLVALVGNQNSGKTTLYNRLTGGKRKTGNFPGVTVDVGVAPLVGAKEITIADLPGIYSLSPFSDEEAASVDFINNNSPDIIVNILDATSLVRNMYLTLQLLETQKPIIVVLNMMDEVRALGGEIDMFCLSRILGTPVIPISAALNQGIDTLQAAISSYSYGGQKFFLPYSGKVLESAKKIAQIFMQDAKNNSSLGEIFKDKNEKQILGFAIQLIAKELTLPLSSAAAIEVEREILQTEREVGLDREAAVADMRYKAAETLYTSCVKEGERKATLTEKLDKVLTHKYFALPIFFAIMATVFYLTFGVFGRTAGLAVETLTAFGIEKVRTLMLAKGVGLATTSFVADGLLGGLGSVFAFLPMITALFFFLSLIEDTGYMARVAFVTDRLLAKIGLSGRSIVPALIGFGCSVPAYMSLRTISSKRDKKLSALLIPFMPCSAKVPVFALFTAVFFAKHQALVMLLLYVLNIAMGVGYAFFLKKTVVKGEPQPLIIELPNYRIPSLNTTASYLWDKIKGFFSRAFSVILLTSVVVWFLRSFGTNFAYTENPENSLLAQMAKFIAPLFSPLGFGDWRAATAIITGLAAKEAVVSTLAVLLGGGTQLFTALRGVFTPLEAMSFLVFCSLYIPCTAALAAFAKEVKSAKFALLSMAAQTVISYIAALVFYTLGRLIIFLSG